MGLLHYDCSSSAPSFFLKLFNFIPILPQTHLEQIFRVSDSGEEVGPESNLRLPGTVDHGLEVLREFLDKCYDSWQQWVCNNMKQN